MDQTYSLEFIARCRSDFGFFCVNVLGYEMSEYHKDICTLPMKHRYLCIIIPTGHSKTTVFSIGYSLWRLFREQNIEIVLVASSLDQSMKVLSKIQDILESNTFFHSLLPVNRLDTWNKKELKTSNGNYLYVKPFNDSARGIHPNYIIYDDLLREDSGLQMSQVKDTFWHIFYPRGQILKCQHVVVGTPMSMDDLYTDFEKPGHEEWHTERRAAVIENNGKWIKPLWPERFSLDVLEKIRLQMGEYRFEREYMCRPRSTGDMLFPQELILNSLDYNLDFTYRFEGFPSVGADFAMSTRITGDFNAFTVVDNMINKTYTKKTDKGEEVIQNPAIIRKIVHFRGSSGQVESIRNLNEYYPGARVIADNSGVGAKFVQELRENAISVDSQDFRPANRNMLLMDLRRLMEQGRIVIPSKGECESLTNNLIKELSGFRLQKLPGGGESWQSTTEHDDLVMSLALAVKGIGSPRKITGSFFYGVP